jgi:Tol biopolymer transport system component
VSPTIGPRVHRIALDGTGLTPLTAIWGATFSPDGRLVAGLALLASKRVWGIAVRSIDGSEPERGFDIASVPVMIQFTPRGDALTFLESRNGPQTLKTQPFDESAPKMLLDLHGETVFGFAWSQDGRLVVAHGPATAGIVMMSGIR